MENVGFFEGPEKLMEVWWTPVLGADTMADLRTISREKWSELLKLVDCTIISEKRNEEMIAYLLSESSMFVSRERLILKTCGQTTLLRSIKPLLELAKTECGLSNVQDFFYSRMNYLAPGLQSTPHQTFEPEVQWLDQLFSDGAGYALGRMNGPDTWYLYTLDNTLPGVNEPDQTLEILMLDLDRQVMNNFYKSVHSDADEVSKVTGITDLLPGAVIDAVLFDPCGYSANGLLNISALKNNNVAAPEWFPNVEHLRNSYFNIHITPQEECSYVSFETNIKVSCYKELISNVLKTFKPGRFLMTLFANEGFFTTAFGMSSGAVVTIMSLDRFASLHCPFLYNKYASPKLAGVSCILLTLFCTILASLPFMNVGDYVLNENSHSFCHFDLFPADRAGLHFLLGLATFGVLLTSVMTFCNIFVFIVVMRIKRRMSKLLPCEMNARRALRCAFRQEERMAKLVALVSVVFLVTWLPVTIRIFCNTLRLHLSQNMDNLSFRLVMVNFLLDPFTYVLFTRGFKRKFQQSITGFREYLRDKHASQKRKIQTSRIENASFAPDTTVLGPALCIAQSSVIRVAVRPVPADLVQTSLPT